MAFLTRMGLHGAWAREVLAAAVMLAVGFGLMPPLIYVAGSAALGRYEGASPETLYRSIYQGLAAGSAASFIVVLGPYALYLLFRGFRLWWRSGAPAP